MDRSDQEKPTSTDAAGDEARFFQERGFGLRIGFGARPALVVVDLTRAFTDPARPLGSELGTQIRATNRLLGAAAAGAVPVVASSVRYDDGALRDAGIWALKQRGTASLRADGDGHEMDPRLALGADAIVLYKKHASCFFGTDLAARLRALGVDTVLIAGTSTSGCVRATAVDACGHGFRPMVVREAVGDRARGPHEASLFDLDAKYADVVSLAEALAYLEGLAAR